jgi:hypothetical protein
MRRRVWIVFVALLLVLNLVPRQAAAASQTQVRTEPKTRSGFVVFWEAVLGVLSPQGSTPPTNGAPGTGARPARPAHPDNDLGPGMDPLG